MVGGITYRWRVDKYKCDPETAYNEIHSLPVVTSETIVEKARDESCPLHDDFEWNDTVAGHKYRLQQARVMLSSLIVVDESISKKENTEVRAFVSVPEPKVYEPIKVVIQHQDKYEHMLEQAVRELKAFERKYAMLKELEPVFEVIEKL